MITLTLDGLRLAAASLAASYSPFFSLQDMRELRDALENEPDSLLASVAAVAGLTQKSVGYLMGDSDEPLDIVRPFARTCLRVGRDTLWFISQIDPGYWRGESVAPPYHAFQMSRFVQAMIERGWTLQLGETGLELAAGGDAIILDTADLLSLVEAYTLTGVVPAVVQGEEN